MEVKIMPHDAELARMARDAFLRFCKGRHPSRLNCGDCPRTPLPGSTAYRCCSRAAT
jgi:uncharacterized protein with PIN domain